MITLSKDLAFNNFKTMEYNSIIVGSDVIKFSNDKKLQVMEQTVNNKKAKKIFYNDDRIYYDCNNCVKCTNCNSECVTCDSCHNKCVTCDSCHTDCYSCNSCHSYCTSCTGCHSCYDNVEPCPQQILRICSYCNRCDSCYGGCNNGCVMPFGGCSDKLRGCARCDNMCQGKHSDCKYDYYTACIGCQTYCDSCVNICYGGTARW